MFLNMHLWFPVCSEPGSVHPRQSHGYGAGATALLRPPRPKAPTGGKGRQLLMAYNKSHCQAAADKIFTCYVPLAHVTPEVTNYPEEVHGSFVDLVGSTWQHLVVRHHAAVAISAVVPTQGHAATTSP